MTIKHAQIISRKNFAIYIRRFSSQFTTKAILISS